MIFCHTSTWISHQYTCVPPSWSPPAHPIHLGCHRALALASLNHTANSHWLSVLHMAMCVFHCYSLKSSHPLLPPLFSKVCSLCLCLLCCPHIELLVLSFWIPYICVNSQYLSFSFWLQSLNYVWLFVTSWTAVHQASLSINNSQSFLKLMSIELVMSSNQIILCNPLLLLPSIFPSIRVFSNELVLCIRWPKY